MPLTEDTVSLWDGDQPPRRRFNFVWNDEKETPTVHRVDTECTQSYDSTSTTLGTIRLIADHGADICGRCCRGIFRYVVEEEGPILEPLAILETPEGPVRVLRGIAEGEEVVAVQQKVDGLWAALGAARVTVESRDEYGTQLLAGIQKAGEYQDGITGVRFADGFEETARCRAQVSLPDAYFEG